jgi:aminoglycoside phosphotransferase (APT) family kinase protein
MLQLNSLGPRLATGGTAELFALADDRVVKLYWQGAGMDAAEREAERTEAAGGLGAPAPRVFEVVSVEERPGVVFERLEGPSMLALFAQEPNRLDALAQQLAEIQARFHASKPIRLPPQREHLVRRINLGPLPARHKPQVLSRLRGLDDGEVLCHGDLHPGNVIMTAGGPRVIDWFDATAGNPAGDLARTCLLLQYARMPRASEGERRVFEALREKFLDAYLARYRILMPEASHALVEWFLPIAGARLAEPIGAPERTALLKVIDSLLAEA